MKDAQPPPLLHRLAREMGTDKHEHQFTLFYGNLLDQFREQAFNLLEIGVFRGESLEMWHRYFPRATIFGADPRADMRTRSSSNYTVLRYDQHVRSDVQALANHASWSVVLDDGSHKPSDQLLTFMNIFPLLRPYGVYIIEDIQTSYFARGYGRGYLYNWNMKDESNETDVVERFLDAVHMVLNRKYQCYEPTRPVFSYAVDARIGSVIFLRNAIAVIKAPNLYRYPDYERLGKSNCKESRFLKALHLPRPVEEVLADSPTQQMKRAAELREPADPQGQQVTKQVPAPGHATAVAAAAAAGQPTSGHGHAHGRGSRGGASKQT